MIDDLIRRCDFPVSVNPPERPTAFATSNLGDLARLITPQKWALPLSDIMMAFAAAANARPVSGHHRNGRCWKKLHGGRAGAPLSAGFSDKRMAIVSVDPSKRKTGGALLGDRIRMNAIASGRVYMRSLATRQSNLALSRHVGDALDILKARASTSSCWRRPASVKATPKSWTTATWPSTS